MAIIKVYECDLCGKRDRTQPYEQLNGGEIVLSFKAICASQNEYKYYVCLDCAQKIESAILIETNNIIGTK